MQCYIVLEQEKDYETKWNKLYNRLNYMRMGLVPDERITDDERHDRITQADMLNVLMMLMRDMEVENGE